MLLAISEDAVVSRESSRYARGGHSRRRRMGQIRGDAADFPQCLGRRRRGRMHRH